MPTSIRSKPDRGVEVGVTVNRRPPQVKDFRPSRRVNTEHPRAGCGPTAPRPRATPGRAERDGPAADRVQTVDGGAPSGEPTQPETISLVCITGTMVV